MADPAPNPGQGTPPKDMSAYIRTYAKDVARLTNQPMPASPPPPPAPTNDGVTLPEFDASPVNRPGGIIKEFKQEVLSVTKEDSSGIFSKPDIPAAPPVAPIPSDELQRREEVLARLRAKIAAPQAASLAPAAPPPPPPPPPPVVPPPPPPAPPPPPPPTPPPGIVPLEREATPLHTYTSDFADRIDQEQASTFTVLAAQQDRGPLTSTPSKKRGGLVAVTLAVILIGIGAGGLFAAYRYLATQNTTNVTLGVPSLVLADEKMELDGPDYRQDLADAAAEPLVEGNILITYVTQASTTDKGGLLRAPQPGGVLIRNLNLGAPDILLRNVDLSSTVGIVAAGGQAHPFFILRVNSFERTFAGMLAWEETMLADLAPLYPEYIELPAPEPAATSTATSSLPAIQAPLPRAYQGFIDTVVANRDVRLLRDRFGRTLILYGYSDKDTLIIARDEAAFTTLVARLAATRGE